MDNYKTEMKIKRLVAVAAIIGTQVVPGVARAEDQSETIQKLIKRIEELEQKQKVQDRKYEIDKEASDVSAKEQPKLSIGEKGFAFTSANGDFELRLKGLIQTDYRTFFNDGGIKGNDGFILRRVRPIIEGTLYRDFSFQFVTDFGGTPNSTLGNTEIPIVQDAWLNYKLRPELQFKVGKFKSPVGLELLQSDNFLYFNERSLVTDLVPNRDLGFQIWGEAFDGVVSYAAGIFGGVADQSNNTSAADFDDNKDAEGRVFFQPFKKTDITALEGFGFGAGGSYGSQTTSIAVPSAGTGLPTAYTSDGQQKFFTYAGVADGQHWRLSPQGYYYYGPFSLLGEYAISNQRVAAAAGSAVAAHLQNTAWEITTGYVLTGEDASYSAGVVPKRAFAPLSGDWGALQLVARYAQLHIDSAAFPTFATAGSARNAEEWSVGLNWYLNRNVKIATSYAHTSFSGGNVKAAGATAPAAVTRQPESVLFTRLQVAF